MICHQAVSVDFAVKFPLEIDEIFQVVTVVVVTNKNTLSVVSALDTMMWGVGENYSCYSRHIERLVVFS